MAFVKNPREFLYMYLPSPKKGLWLMPTVLVLLILMPASPSNSLYDSPCLNGTYDSSCSVISVTEHFQWPLPPCIKLFWWDLEAPSQTAPLGQPHHLLQTVPYLGNCSSGSWHLKFHFLIETIFYKVLRCPNQPARCQLAYKCINNSHTISTASSLPPCSPW